MAQAKPLFVSGVVKESSHNSTSAHSTTYSASHPSRTAKQTPEQTVKMLLTLQYKLLLFYRVSIDPARHVVVGLVRIARLATRPRSILESEAHAYMCCAGGGAGSSVVDTHEPHQRDDVRNVQSVQRDKHVAHLLVPTQSHRSEPRRRVSKPKQNKNNLSWARGALAAPIVSPPSEHRLLVRVRVRARARSNPWGVCVI